MSAHLKLLAVDDDAPSAELIVRVAERCGYEAFATSDSRGVISLIQALRPDVLAVDISMPHIDAIELFKLLAQTKFEGQIIVVSGQDQPILELTRSTAEMLGLSRPHLHQKPLDFAALRETLNGYRVSLTA
jgi:CheY-like chemotaxis protein